MSIDSRDDVVSAIFILLLILGTWKFVDIIIWFLSHLAWV